MEAEQEDACGSLAEIERSSRTAKRLCERGVHNADQSVSAPESTNNLLVMRTRAHRSDKSIGDGKCHIGINKRDTNLGEASLKVCLTDATSTTEPLE